MEEQKLQEFKEDFALLIEAGFIAVKQLDEISSTRIFQAAQVLNPASTAPQIGLGYIALNKLEVKEAIRIFETVLKQEPENHMAQSFLGICFLLTPPKRKKGEQLLQQAMESSNNPTIKNLGKVSLEWAEKDLRKDKKAPFFSGKQTEENEKE